MACALSSWSSVAIVLHDSAKNDLRFCPPWCMVLVMSTSTTTLHTRDKFASDRDYQQYLATQAYKARNPEAAQAQARRYQTSRDENNSAYLQGLRRIRPEQRLGDCECSSDPSLVIGDCADHRR